MTAYRSVFRSDSFQGAVVLVTGGGTGIGRTIAFELASYVMNWMDLNR